MLNKENENGALPMEDKDLVKVAGGTEGEVQMTAQIIREVLRRKLFRLPRW